MNLCAHCDYLNFISMSLHCMYGPNRWWRMVCINWAPQFKHCVNYTNVRNCHGNWKPVACLVQMRVGQTPNPAQCLFSRSSLLLASKSHRCWLRRGSLSLAFMIFRNNTFNCNSHKNTYDLPQNTIPIISTSISWYTYTSYAIQLLLCVIHQFKTLLPSPKPLLDDSLPNFLYVNFHGT